MRVDSLHTTCLRIGAEIETERQGEYEREYERKNHDIRLLKRILAVFVRRLLPLGTGCSKRNMTVRSISSTVGLLWSKRAINLAEIRCSTLGTAEFFELIPVTRTRGQFKKHPNVNIRSSFFSERVLNVWNKNVWKCWVKLFQRLQTPSNQ